MQILKETQWEIREAQAVTRKKAIFADLILIFSFIKLFSVWRLLWREHHQAILSGSFNTIDSQTLFIFITLLILPFISFSVFCKIVPVCLGLPNIHLNADGMNVNMLVHNKFYPWSSIGGFFVSFQGSHGGGQVAMKVTAAVDGDRKAFEKGYIVLMSLGRNVDRVVANLNQCRDATLRLRDGTSNLSVANIIEETSLQNKQAFRRWRWMIVIPILPSLFSFLREVSSPAPDYEKAFLSLIPVLVIIVTFWLISFLVRRAGKLQGNSEN